MSANISQEFKKDKRYLVTVSYYSYNPDDESAKRESLAFVGKLNKEQDCTASVDEILEVPRGIKSNRKIL